MFHTDSSVGSLCRSLLGYVCLWLLYCISDYTANKESVFQCRWPR